MEHHSHTPEVGILLTCASILLNVVDLTKLDTAYFEPLAHIAAAASGFTAVTMFILNYIKDNKKRKP